MLATSSSSTCATGKLRRRVVDQCNNHESGHQPGFKLARKEVEVAGLAFPSFCSTLLRWKRRHHRPANTFWQADRVWAASGGLPEISPAGWRGRDTCVAVIRCGVDGARSSAHCPVLSSSSLLRSAAVNLIIEVCAVLQNPPRLCDACKALALAFTQDFLIAFIRGLLIRGAVKIARN